MNAFSKGAKTLILILAFSGVSSLAMISPSAKAQLSTPVTRDVTTLSGTWLEQKVTANDGKPYDDFDSPVAISGNTALVGQNGNGYRAVYVFTHQPDGSWVQTQKLTSGDGAAGSSPHGGGRPVSDGFGCSIAVSGTVAVIGACSATVNGNPAQGAAYIFKESDGIWTQVQKLIAGDGIAYDLFGRSVAVSDSFIFVGAFAAVDGNPLQGAVYVFAKSGNSWTQTQKLTASDGAAYGDFGISGANVIIDGTTAFIGANPTDSVGIPLQGAVYVFTETDGMWAQAQKLTVSDAGDENDFGITIGVSGSTLLVDADSTNGLIGVSAAWIFNKANGIWTEAQKITPDDGSQWGQVAISGDTAVIGAPFATVGRDEDRGKVLVFKKSSNGTWNQTMTLVSSDGFWFDQYGESVAMSDDNTIMVGSYATIGDDSYNQGAVYFYELADVGLSVDAPGTVEPGQNYLSQVIATNSASTASPAVSLVVPVPPEASFISASSSQGDCGFAAETVTCDLGNVAGNAGMATADITLKNTRIAPGKIENTASIAKATPAVSASAATTIVGHNPPVASDGMLATDKNKSASGTLVATSPDGDPLTFSIASQPANGTVELTDASKGSYTYTPNKGFSGKGSFAFTASDGEATSNVATVSVTVKNTSSGGGGGAFGWLGLAALLGLVVPVLVRRKRARA